MVTDVLFRVFMYIKIIHLSLYSWFLWLIFLLFDTRDVCCHNITAFDLLMHCFQVFDEAGELKHKVKHLAEAFREAKHLVVYTGAGISTVHLTSPLNSPWPSSTLTALMVSLILGSFYPRLQRSEWGVDPAAEGTDCKVRDVIFVILRLN